MNRERAALEDKLKILMADIPLLNNNADEDEDDHNQDEPKRITDALKKGKKSCCSNEYWEEEDIPKFPEDELASQIRQKLKFSMHNSLRKLLTVFTF